MIPRGSQKLTKTAWIMLGVTILPTIYVLYQDIILMSSSGYGSTLGSASGIMRIMVLLSGLFQSALLILYCFENKHRKIVFGVILAFFALQFAGGSRIAAFRFVVIMLIISHQYRKEMNRKRWSVVVIGGVILTFVFPLVSSIRNYVFMSRDIGMLVEGAIQELLEENFIFSAIREMGNTQCINTLVYNRCPDKISHAFGLSYLRGLYGIIPNIFGVGYDTVDTVFSPLYTVTSAGMGSSYIAEGYWNFGYFAIFVYIAYGYVWGILVEKFRIQCNQTSGNASGLFITVYIMFFLIFTVRSDFMEFGRSLVYYAIVPVILSKLSLKRSRH